jgi:hypothetical protein
MKIIRVLGDPRMVSFLFCLIIVSGESFGGVFLMYLLLALPAFSIHSVLGVAGLITINLKSKSGSRTEWLILLGVLFMLSSICSFFLTDKQNYNRLTFVQVVPLVSISLFLLSILFLFISVWHHKRRYKL